EQTGAPAATTQLAGAAGSLRVDAVNIGATLVSAPTTPGARAMLERAKPCVFQVQVFDEVSTPLCTGTGFITTPDGFAITNFHVVQGGASAKAVLTEDSEPVALELYAVYPQLD